MQEIKKSDLKHALEIVKPGLANKELIHQSTSFAFMDGNVVTFNDKISVSHPVKGLELTGAVKAEEMDQVLSKLTAENLKLDIGENELLIKAGKSSIGLQLSEEILLPIEEVDEIGEMYELPKDFLEAAKMVSQAASRDNSMELLTCIEVDTDGLLSASDNVRVSRATLSKDMPVDTFLLPVEVIPQLIKIKPTLINLTEAWVHFANEEGTRLSARTFADEFPDITSILEVENTIDIPLPADLVDMIDRAGVFAQGLTLLDEKLTIQIEKGRIRVKSECATGWYKEAAKCEYKGESITFEMVPHLFKEVLNKMSICKYSKEQQVVKFEDETWQYVVSLI